MHILFLTDNFPPENNAPANRTFDHAKEWVSNGHKVTVITCVPNFPAGKVYKGYKNKIYQTEQMSGIRVIRVWTFISANSGFLLRICDFISFMVSSFFAGIFVRKVDVIVGTSPQFFTACAAFLLGLIRRRPYIFELRDLWPDSLKAVGVLRNRYILIILESLELFLYRKALKIVCVTQSFRDNLVGRGIESGKIHVVKNGVDNSRFYPRKKDQKLLSSLNLDGKFVIGYIGTHGMAHGLETILQSAKLLQKTELNDQVRFLFVGSGSEKNYLINLSKRLNLKNIVFLDSVSRIEMPRYLSLVDVSIIHLKKTDLFKTVIPSKLFECMAMGIPVLHGVEGESSDIVKKYMVGMLFSQGDETSLTLEIQKIYRDQSLLSEFKGNAIKAARHFDRKMMAEKMLSVFVETGVKINSRFHRGL